MIADVVRAVDRLKDLTSTVILKCPGHAKVALNCMADWTAKRGARGITSDSPLPADVVSQILRGEEVEDIPVVLPGRLRLSPLSDSDDSDLDDADSFMPADTTLLDSDSDDNPLRPVTTARRSARTSKPLFARHNGIDFSLAL